MAKLRNIIFPCATILVWLWSFMSNVSLGFRRPHQERSASSSSSRGHVSHAPAAPVTSTRIVPQGSRAVVYPVAVSRHAPQRTFAQSSVEEVAKNMLKSSVLYKAKKRYDDAVYKGITARPYFIVEIDFEKRSKVVLPYEARERSEHSLTARPLCCSKTLSRLGGLQAFLPNKHPVTTYDKAERYCKEDQATICSLPDLRNYFLDEKQFDRTVVESSLRDKASQKYWVRDVMPPMSSEDGEVAEYMRYIVASWQRMVSSSIGVCAWGFAKHFHSGQGDVKLIEEVLEAKNKSLRDKDRKLIAYDMLDVNYKYFAKIVVRALTELKDKDPALYDKIVHKEKPGMEELLLLASCGPLQLDGIVNDNHLEKMASGVARNVVFRWQSIAYQRPAGFAMAAALFGVNFLPFLFGKILVPAFVFVLKLIEAGGTFLHTVFHMNTLTEFGALMGKLATFFIWEEVYSTPLHVVSSLLAPGALNSPVLNAWLVAKLHRLHHWIQYEMLFGDGYKRYLDIFNFHMGLGDFPPCQIPETTSIKKKGHTLMLPSDSCGIFENIADKNMCQAKGTYKKGWFSRQNQTSVDEIFDGLTGRCDVMYKEQLKCSSGRECMNPGLLQSALVRRSPSAIVFDFEEDLEKIVEIFMYGGKNDTIAPDACRSNSSQTHDLQEKDEDEEDEEDEEEEEDVDTKYVSESVLATYTYAKTNFVTPHMLSAVVNNFGSNGNELVAKKALTLIWYVTMQFAKTMRRTYGWHPCRGFMYEPEYQRYWRKTKRIDSILPKVIRRIDAGNIEKDDKKLVAAMLGYPTSQDETFLKDMFKQVAKMLVRLLMHNPVKKDDSWQSYTDAFQTFVNQQKGKAAYCSFQAFLPTFEGGWWPNSRIDEFDAIAKGNHLLFGGSHVNKYFEGFPTHGIYAEIEVSCTKEEDSRHEICCAPHSKKQQCLQLKKGEEGYTVKLVPERDATRWYTRCE
eukprot:TRINITY_DN2396_c0_g1_i1.p1 TRINITY_DN2396_c0_g1~~TRINITY_DN2396_c0_g1_i1.p1  ORF type:complete len:984 (+),score=112.68 TRINITY_DN2396_c0_g1_i1:70-2952(+)